MNNTITFKKCDCKIVSGQFNINNIPLDCPATWRLISSGYTTGIFQLEKKLGQDWAAKVKPKHMEELSALGALLRPGCLESQISENYVEVKFGRKEKEYINNKLEPILDTTYGQMVYQEQTLKICVELAGFNLIQADNMRKAIGKKIPALMAKLKSQFIDGCMKNQIAQEVAEEIFGWIEKSQRYCVSGDTIIRRLAKTNKHKTVLSVQQMHSIKNNMEYAKQTGHLSLYKKWKRLGHYGQGLSLCKDGRIRPNIIRDIQPASRQQLFLVTTESGKMIKTTITHKFPTPNGEKTLEQLKVGDLLFICTQYEKTNIIASRNANKFSNETNSTRYLIKNGSYTNSGYTKYMKFKKDTSDECSVCKTSEYRIEVHHIDGDRTNNNHNNLIKLCTSCHKKEEYKNGRTKIGEKGYPVLLEKIASITKSKKEVVWNISMDGPNHNFVVSGNIVTSNSFNKSHSMCYAFTGYYSAYIKCHFPHEFFTSWLNYSHYKGDPKEEIFKLIQDARLFNVQILPPDIRKGNVHFKLVEKPNKSIAWGLSHIRGVGQSAINKIIEASKGSLKTWNDFLKSVPIFHRNVGMALIKAGACDCYKMPRTQMINELEILLGTSILNSQGEKEEIRGLTEKELEWFFEELKTHKKSIIALQIMADYRNDYKSLSSLKKSELIDLLIKLVPGIELKDLSKNDLLTEIKKAGYDKPKRKQITSRRLEIIKEKINKLNDNLIDKNSTKAAAEKHFLGIALSCSAADDIDNSDATYTCLEAMKESNEKIIKLCCIIEKVRLTKTKKGRNPGEKMCFLTVSDSTYSLESIVVFPRVYQEFNDLCKEENIILLEGKKQNSSIIVQNIIKLI